MSNSSCYPLQELSTNVTFIQIQFDQQYPVFSKTTRIEWWNVKRDGDKQNMLQCKIVIMSLLPRNP